MGKFIKAVRRGGQVELNIIRGDVEETTFASYGKIVFELFYRADLSVY
jgi:hypothetical protein